MHLLKASDDETFFHYRFDRVSQHSALVFRLTGTNGATATTLNDVGRIRYTVRGRTLVDSSFEYLSGLTKVFGGDPITTSTISGPLDLAVLIPRFWGDDNIELIDPSDNATFEISFGGNVATRVASGFLAELYAIPEIGLNSYQLMLMESSDSIGGAGVFQMASPPGTMENIVACYMSELVSNVLTLSSGLITRVDGNIGSAAKINASIGALKAITNMKNELGGSFDLLAEIYSADIGDLAGRLNDSLNLNVHVSAASEPRMLLVGLAFNPDKLAQSAALLTNDFNQSLNRKQAAGHRRSVQVLRTVSGR